MATLKEKVNLVARLCADAKLAHSYLRVAVTQILKFHNTERTQCNPSLRRIAEASAVCRDTVIEANKKLVQLNYSEIARSNGGRNRRNRYRFKWETGKGKTVDGSDHFDTPASDVNGRRFRPETVDGSDSHRTHEQTHEKESQRGKKVKGNGLEMPPGWKPLEAYREELHGQGYADERIAKEIDKCRDWYKENWTRPPANWDDAFRKWMVKDKEHMERKGYRQDADGFYLRPGSKPFNVWKEKWERENSSRVWGWKVAEDDGTEVCVPIPYPKRGDDYYLWFERRTRER